MAELPNREEAERKLARMLAKFLAAYGGRLLEAMGDPPRLENMPLDFWDKEGKELAKILGPFGQDIFLEMAKGLVESQPIGVSWSQVNEAAIRWINDYSFEMVKKINENTRNVITQALTNYYSQGQTIGQLEQAIAPVFGPVRAEAIAVTEISRAANWGEFGTVQALTEQGIKMEASFHTSHDEIVCPVCRPLNRKKADRYRETGEPVWVHPKSGKEYGLDPLHPRCRCWRNWSIAGVE